MAAENALDAQPPSFENAKATDGFNSVLGARGGETAAGGKERRQQQLVHPNEENREPSETMLKLDLHTVAPLALTIASPLCTRTQTAVAVLCSVRSAR